MFRNNCRQTLNKSTFIILLRYHVSSKPNGTTNYSKHTKDKYIPASNNHHPLKTTLLNSPKKNTFTYSNSGLLTTGFQSRQADTTEPHLKIESAGYVIRVRLAPNTTTSLTAISLILKEKNS